jgi:hypothetical protein
MTLYELTKLTAIATISTTIAMKATASRTGAAVGEVAVTEDAPVDVFADDAPRLHASR